MSERPRASEPIAVLYQSAPPPAVGGVHKPMKPGGYSDSGADIAFTLRAAGLSVLTPGAGPDPERALDWLFPDTPEGLAWALSRGARVLWANTVLFSGHPLETLASGEVRIVGQHPSRMERYDDKWRTNEELRAAGCPVAASCLVGREAASGTLALEGLDAAGLEARGLRFPLVIKPIRGRGSEGVRAVHSLAELQRAAEQGLGRYGPRMMVERFLSGAELTVTVMPPGTYAGGGQTSSAGGHWSLPPVRRFNHHEGIAPYNGTVAVVDNSAVLSGEELRAPEVERVKAWCEVAARQVEARAPIRIDCRADASGEFFLFDLNMKPNLTGPGRPGRENQDSLCGIAARGLGWSYAELLLNMLRGAWQWGT